jgi:ABC-type transport system involved in cytochrome c biogenesis permease component
VFCCASERRQGQASHLLFFSLDQATLLPMRRQPSNSTRVVSPNSLLIALLVAKILTSECSDRSLDGSV